MCFLRNSFEFGQKGGVRGDTSTSGCIRKARAHKGTTNITDQRIPKAPQTSKANRSKYYFSDRKRSPKEVRYMESAFGTQVPLLHCSFLFISLFFPRTICWIIGCKQKCGCCFHRKSVPKLARTPAEDTGTLQTNYGRDGGRGEGKDVGEEMASTMGSSAWEASHFGRGPFRRDAKQGSGF